MTCYRFIFNIKMGEEIKEPKTSVNIVAKNYDYAKKELDNWAISQKIEIVNLKCTDDFFVWVYN